ncbi:MAG: DUF721 domain-containing protein [Chlamydiia bacterium]|nr:DUF721 domain-containing protein [Chlamydiia bacterium]
MANRTPRAYNGVNSPSKKMAQVLPEILAEIDRRIVDPKEAVFNAWREILGEKMSPLMEPLTFIDGVLTIKVKGSTLYSLLCQHEKPRLLRQLREKFQIRDLVFRIG